MDHKQTSTDHHALSKFSGFELAKATLQGVCHHAHELPHGQHLHLALEKMDHLRPVKQKQLRVITNKSRERT